MQDTTKHEIQQYLKDISSDFRQEEIARFSTQSISAALNISRNLASQYLNTLNKEGKLIKINTRPVYFIDKSVLETSYHIKIKENSYLSTTELFSILEASRKNNSNFQKAIGKNGSLSYCIDQCITAISYPKHGLPALILGDNGSGKTYLTNLICEYAIDHHIIASKDDFQSIHCMKYMDDTTAFLSTLSQLEKLRDHTRIILFDDIHTLSAEAQEKLILLLDEALSQQKISAQHRFLFTASRLMENRIKRKLISRIPVIIHIPSLEERSINEKEELIYHFYDVESTKVERSIYISNTVFTSFINYTFEDNISGLRNAVQLSVANALMKQQGNDRDPLNIYLYDLPDTMISFMSTDKKSFDELTMIKIDTLLNRRDTNQVVEFYTSILEEYQKFQYHHMNFNQLLSDCYQSVNQYYEYLMFIKQYANSKIKAIEHITNEILENLEDTYHLYFPTSCRYTLARCVYTRIQMQADLIKWENEHTDSISDLQALLVDYLPKESILADEISNLLNRSLDTHLGIMEIILVILNIQFYNHDIHNTETAGMIVAHGYSTASSIADVANTMIGHYIFEAIDMPLSMQMPEIAEKIKKIIHIKRNVKNLILLVDMGSLEDLGTYLQDIPNINIGIANNISTGLAIDIGYKILGNANLENIMHQSCSSHTIKYKIIANHKKEKAIIFTSENSSKVNEKLVSLFIESLPKKTGIHILPCDYKQLLESGSHDFIFDSYDVIFICGTLNPNVENIPFIPLDDMVNTNEIAHIASALYPYLNKEELLQFQQNLLINFSLQNIVGYLTILDAKKVIDFVGNTISLLQQRLHIDIDFNTSIGLFIHISCMIERLVTHTAIDEPIDLFIFEKEKVTCIDNIRSCFKNICVHYGISIPTCELLYIYDYIEEFLPN